ncbi:MAG: hypothetical protein B7Z16_01010, partial [Algoriphagus sp. 32-45-6]
RIEMKKNLIIILVLIAILLPQISEAQCAMCRAVLESGEDNATARLAARAIEYILRKVFG